LRETILALNKKYALLISFIFLSQISFSQSFFKLSPPEKWWVITHPFIACKAKKLTKIARIETATVEKDTVLDHDPQGGQVDAFRHAYWMAMLSQKMKWKKAIRLGIAHEKGNYRQYKKSKTEEGVLPDSVSGAMDLFNNNIGAAIGCNNKFTSLKELKELIITAILEGKMKIIAKSPDGQPVDCNNKKLILPAGKPPWNLPKCLRSSQLKK
jgi:hypothetical protein